MERGQDGPAGTGAHALRRHAPPGPAAQRRRAACKVLSPHRWCGATLQQLGLVDLLLRPRERLRVHVRLHCAAQGLGRRLHLHLERVGRDEGLECGGRVVTALLRRLGLVDPGASRIPLLRRKLAAVSTARSSGETSKHCMPSVPTGAIPCTGLLWWAASGQRGPIYAGGSTVVKEPFDSLAVPSVRRLDERRATRVAKPRVDDRAARLHPRPQAVHIEWRAAVWFGALPCVISQLLVLLDGGGRSEPAASVSGAKHPCHPCHKHCHQPQDRHHPAVSDTLRLGPRISTRSRKTRTSRAHRLS